MTDDSTPHGRAEKFTASAFDAAAFEFTVDAETSAAITPAGSAASAAASGSAADAETSAGEVLPTFSEQLAEQLGGVRGVLESSIPIAVFIIVNFWALRPAMIVVDRIRATDRRRPPAAPADHPARGQRGVRRRRSVSPSPGGPAAPRTSTCRASS